MCAVLAAATLAVYWPVTHNAFTNYDDDYYVTANPLIQRGLSWEGLAWAFGALHGDHTYWHPVTWISHMVDCQFFGLQAAPHHMISLLFHLLNTMLVFLVFHRMTGAYWRCGLLAALFALHPLQVDTVAWIAERKNLLSALFWLLTLWAYACYAEASHEKPNTGTRSRKLRYYAVSLCCFAIGLMCKPVLVTLPFVLLLLDYWPLKRRGTWDAAGPQRGQSVPPGGLLVWRKLIWEKSPFFGLAAVSCLITIISHRDLGMLDVAFLPPFLLRTQNALVSYVSYLGNAFYPAKLAVFYPFPAVVPMGKVVLSTLLLLGISGLAIGGARHRPYLLVGWLWFLGVLVPFIGLIQAGSQAMADRFAYVPLIGLFLSLVWSAEALARRWRCGTAIMSTIALAVVVACAVGTRRQISYWKDDERLFRHALAVTESNPLAQLNLGAALNAKERFDEAVGHLQEAVRLSPNTAIPRINLAYALAQKGRLSEAVEQYDAALRLSPADAGVHNDIGLTLARQGRAEEAIQHYQEALRLKPDFAQAHYNLGLSLAGGGKFAEAAVHFQEVLRLDPRSAGARQKLELAMAAQARSEAAAEPWRQALRLDPNDARAHAELGQVLLEAGRIDEALEQCSEAARLEPRNPKVQYQLGAVLARKGEREKAAMQFERVLELDGNLAEAHYSLGILRQQQGRMGDALRHWREAARLAPRWADPLNNLAWALATSPQAELRDAGEAVKLATRAMDLAGTNNVGVLDTLAAAYAAAERFEEASATARRAQAVATALGQAKLADEIQHRLALYNSNRPYRYEPGAK